MLISIRNECDMSNVKHKRSPIAFPDLAIDNGEYHFDIKLERYHVVGSFAT